MAIHRATTMTHSAAEARIRNGAQSAHHWNSNYFSADMSSDPDSSSTHPRGEPSVSISPNYSHYDDQKRLSLPPSSLATDPTQPLLPTTRFHALYPSDTALSQPAELELTDYHRMPAKTSSGTYIGLLCIVLVWLLPIGIIVSGGTGGEIVAQAVTPLFGRPAQVPVEDVTFVLRPFIWEQVRRGEHCLRYKTREYTARSMNASKGQAGIEECRRTPAQIHEVQLQPTFCEDLGLWRGIWGHWVVDFGEPDCETSWADFQDEGCQSENGNHRFTAKLDRFNPADNWLIMCSTTVPNYHFKGKRFSVPTTCQRAKDVVQGVWEIPDRSCEAASVPPS